ncbi:MAG: transposase [Motiliproteus sp.]
MSRPLRIEFSGALYHVTSRGNAREAIYLGDEDRDAFLEVLGDVCQRYNWVVHAYCLMTNHYHLFVETPDGNLSKGMRQLNGVYTQRFNHAHSRVGHVFQGRYKAILVDKESYLLELARYIVLNPVRAKMVAHAADWPWSSYRATAGLVTGPDWLAIEWLLSVFSARKKSAQSKYGEFVKAGDKHSSPWSELKNQIYLGDQAFVDDMQCKISADASLSDVPAIQKRQVAKPLEHYVNTYPNRDTAIAMAYQSGGYSLKEVGDYFGLHYSRVSRIVRGKEGAKGKT